MTQLDKKPVISNLMFNKFLYQPLFNALIFLTKILGNNFGLAIIVLTLLIRGILIPLTLPSLKSAQKIRDLKPELDKLKKKFGHDKKTLQQQQLGLYQKHGINPAAGCLPNIAQFAILIALYRVFINFLQNGGGVNNLNLHFLWLDLTQPDPYYILPIFAGLVQLTLSLMISPAIEHHREKSKKETEDVQDMAETMQQQMMFIMPVMTVLIALRFPSGLALYWITTILFSLVQQYAVSGWGGLAKYLGKLGIKVS